MPFSSSFTNMPEHVITQASRSPVHVTAQTFRSPVHVSAAAAFALLLLQQLPVYT
jgi:hypothetical protein